MVDLRLALPAAVAWLVVGVTIGWPSALPVVAVGAWVVTALTIGMAAILARESVPRAGSTASPPARSSARRRAARGLIVVALLTVATALVVTSAAARAPSREPMILADAGGSGRQVDLVATTTEAVLTGGTRFSVRMMHAEVAGEEAAIDVPALAFIDPAESALAIGTVVTLSGSIVPTDPGDDLAFLVFVEGQPEVVAEPPLLLTATDTLREGLRNRAAELPGDGAGLLPGLAIGDTAAVSVGLDDAMKASSLSHLTAVSGANCAVVVGLVMLVGGLVGLRRVWRIGVSVLVLAGFVLLVTPEPSVLRAAVMAVIVLVSLASGRPAQGMPVLSLAVIVLLGLDPWLAREYGFILSVLATGGLLLLAGPLTRSLARVLPTPLAAVIAIPLAAQLACQPVIVLLSPTLPTFGVIANILAGPAAPVGTVLGLLACVVAPVAPWAADLLVALAWLPSSWIAGVARFFADAPGARLPWIGDAAGVMLLAVVTIALILMVLASPRSSRVLWSAGAAVVALSVVGYLGIAGGGILRTAISRPADWMYGTCDVGQGDASLVRSGGRVAVIDVGSDPELMTSCLDTLGLARVDLLVLTHFDLDHVGGAAALIGRVDRVLVGPVGRPENERIVDSLRRGGARVDEVSRGDAGTLGRLRWTVLWPTDPLRGTEPGNDASVTMLFDGGDAGDGGAEGDGGDGGDGGDEACPSALFLGDLGENAQARMIAPTSVGEVDIVKVAHHGSSDQSEGLYARLDASVALIGVGADNDYGHPTDRTLTMLEGTGTVITRTDRDGLVLVAETSEGLEVWRERGG